MESGTPTSCRFADEVELSTITAMAMKRSFFISLLASAAVFTSCDTSTEPLAGCSLENSLKLQTGNWWVYNYSDLGPGNVVISGSERLDSVVVESTGVMLGKTSYLLVNYSTADGGITYTTDSTWIAVEGGQAYIIDNSLFPLSCQCIDKRWIKFADCSAEGWALLDSSILEQLPSRVVTPGGQDSLLITQSRYRFTVTGARGAQSTMDVAGRSVPVQEYRLDDVLRIELLEPADIQFLDGGRMVRSVKQLRFHMADGIGISSMERTVPETINTLLDGTEKHSPSALPDKGMRRELLRWSVK